MRNTKIWLLPVMIALFALIMAGCEKTGDDPVGNVAPETRILSYVISSAAELDTAGNPTTFFKVTVYWAGSDQDGQIKAFRYSMDGVNFDSTTTKTQLDFVFDFANAASTYNVWVKAVDNLDALDPTAATVTIQRDFGGVETSIEDGPPHGAIVSAGVQYKIKATTHAGTITKINYRVGETAWSQVDADALGEATILITGLTAGSKILYFAGERDDGKVDQTPVAISLIVRVGEFAPTIVNNSAIVDGGGWFAGVQTTFSWSVVTGYYYGALPAEPYSWSFGDQTNLDYGPGALASGWSSNTSVDHTPAGTDTVFYLKVRDAAGAISLMTINYSSAVPGLDQGILVVNGVDPATYGSEITDRIDNASYWGTFNVAFWDLFGTMGAPNAAFTLPAGVTYVGGGYKVPPAELGKYSTVLWLGNNFNGDLPYWQLSPIAAYLEVGGNIFLASRLTADFITADFASYMGIAWREGSANESSAGTGLAEAIAVFPGLADLSPFNPSSSLGDVFSSFPFNSGAGMTDDDVTNWDGTRCFSQDATSTLLYAHRSADFIGSFGFVRGVGVWAHPNLPFADLAVPQYPTPGTVEAQGNFIMICGRNYRHNIAGIEQSFPYILQNLCGEQ